VFREKNDRKEILKGAKKWEELSICYVRGDH